MKSQHLLLFTSCGIVLSGRVILKVLNQSRMRSKVFSPMKLGMNPKFAQSLRSWTWLRHLETKSTLVLSWLLSASKVVRSHPANDLSKLILSFKRDAVRDEENPAAVVDAIAASASTNLNGLNLIVAYGLLDGNQATTSNCIKAYAQFILSSSQPTYVLLPIESCAPLIKSLNGHPLASASWQSHSLPISWMDLNSLRSSHHAFIFQACD